MVQLSSPQPEIQPVQRENKQQRTLSRSGRTDKSEFRRTLENRKSAERKDSAPGTTEKGKTRRDEDSHRPAETGKESLRPGEKKLLKTKPKSPRELPVFAAEEGRSLKEPGRKNRASQRTLSGTDHPAIGAVPAGEQAPVVSDRLIGIAAGDAGSGSPVLEAGAGREGGVLPETPVVPQGDAPPGGTAEQMPESLIKGKEGLVDASPGQNRGSSLTGRKKARSGQALGAEKNRPSAVISVEDRRTVKSLKAGETGKPVFSPAEEQAEGSLTLEMAPREELDGTVIAPETGNRTQQFVRHSAEEQKGSFLLNKQLQEGGTKELTKNIRFVLKDHNQGEIKLILKPEALGKVRIQLNLQENNIVGKIFVENNSVRQVFLNNLPDLAKALEESGFQTSSLDVSVGDGRAGRQNQHRDEVPVFFQRDTADLEDHIPVVFEGASALSQIDLVI